MINYGDTLVLFEEGKPKQLMTITLNQTYQNKHGAYHHHSFIGKQYGSKILSKNNQGPIYFLQPTPHLITDTVAHKTQILFLPDIAMIILKLNVKPNAIVIESGTGSGSLSSSLAQAVGPNGKLYTYEFNQDRAQNGTQLLNNLKYPQATCIHRDVYGEGFLKESHDDTKEFPSPNTVDAIFLDLPQPWLALGHSLKMIKKGGRICCFSPCIEQVEKTIAKLNEDGWHCIETLECLKRQFERRARVEGSLFIDEPTKKVCTEDKDKKVYYSAGESQAHGHTGFLTYAQFT